MVGEALELKRRLSLRGKEAAVYSCVSLTNMEEDLYAKAMLNHHEIITMEENNSSTGLGSKIRKVLTERDICGRRLRCFGIDHSKLEIVGDQAYLRQTHNLDAESVEAFLHAEGWI